MTDGCYELANAIVIQAANDYRIGFRALYKKYGKKFLTPGFAVSLPRKKDDVIPPYAVAETGKKLTRDQSMYFDTLDFFFSDYFSCICSLDPEALVEGLRREMLREMREKGENKELPPPKKKSGAA